MSAGPGYAITMLPPLRPLPDINVVAVPIYQPDSGRYEGYALVTRADAAEISREDLALFEGLLVGDAALPAA